MNECYGFTNPIVLESDAYFYLRKEVEAYRKAIDNLDWQLERRRQYLRGCSKADLEPDEDIVAAHDGDIFDAQVDLIGVREGFFNEDYP